MSYRPKHPLIVVVNADGSGYTLQFSTLAEAKTAYALIAGDGVAYLYSSSKNSLSSGDGYEAIPEYNNGITYGTGALVSLNGSVYRLINFIGAGGYGPIAHPSLWTTNVVLPSALPPISSSGFTDGARRGMTFTTAQNISFTPEGCPSAGTILEEANISPIIIPIYGQQVEVGTTVYNLVADGACDSYEVTTSVGYVPNGTLVASDATNNYFSNGEGGYYLEALPPAPPNIIGYEGFEDFLTTALFSVVYRTRVRPQYDNNTVGEWSVWSYTAYGTYYGDDDFNNYYSDGADSYYSELKPVCDASGTWIEGINSDIVFSSPCGDFTVGQSTYSIYADGACGTYSESGNNYHSQGTFLGSCGSDNYYSDGTGGAYVFVSAGTPTVTLAGNQTLTTYDYLGTPFNYVWQTFDTVYYHDGSGGYYSVNENVNTQPAGALIRSGVIDVGSNVSPDELNTEALYISYVTYDERHDGNGSYFTDNNQFQTYSYGTPLPCPAYGNNPYPYHILVADAGAGYDFGYQHDGSFRNFLADGVNGYFVTMHTASYFAAESVIGYSPNGVVKWDGSGGYYEDTN